jgi:membrane associated rhomboid family serine protease
MIPIRDDQPCSSFAWVNYFIIAANIAVFGYEISLGLHTRALYEFWVRRGVVPHNFELAFSGSAQITISGVFLTILTSMFLHGSVLHLLGNVWCCGFSATILKTTWGMRSIRASMLFVGW